MGNRHGVAGEEISGYPQKWLGNTLGRGLSSAYSPDYFPAACVLGEIKEFVPVGLERGALTAIKMLRGGKKTLSDRKGMNGG